MTNHSETPPPLDSARSDTVTGLPDRASFLSMVDALRKTVARQGGQELALLLVDLDLFKAMSDTLVRHQVGEVLLQVANILRDVTREFDVAGRLGGDEFVLCLTADTMQIEETATRVADQIVERVRAIGFVIACSVGICIWPSRCPAISCVMRRADHAMYEAKRWGKNRHALFGADARTDGASWVALSPPECNVECVV